MKQIFCESCGSNDFIEQNGYRICQYCNAKYLVHHEEFPQKGSNIALTEDIRMLLIKCKEDPANAKVIFFLSETKNITFPILITFL